MHGKHLKINYLTDVVEDIDVSFFMNGISNYIDYFYNISFQLVFPTMFLFVLNYFLKCKLLKKNKKIKVNI